MREETRDMLKRLHDRYSEKYAAKVVRFKADVGLKISEGRQRIESYEAEIGRIRDSDSKEDSGDGAKLKRSKLKLHLERKRERIKRGLAEEFIKNHYDSTGEKLVYDGESVSFGHKDWKKLAGLERIEARKEHREYQERFRREFGAFLERDAGYIDTVRKISDLYSETRQQPEVNGLSDRFVRESKVKGLEEMIAYERSRIDSERSRIENLPPSSELAYIKRVADLADREESPQIEKIFVEPLNEEGYSISLAGSPVMQRTADGRYSLVFASSQKAPLKEFVVNTEVRDEEKAIEIFDLGMNDYITCEGIVLFDEAKELSEKIFGFVREGIEIFPVNYETVLRRLAKQQGRPDEVASRHWGQSYLAGLQPDEIIVGQIFGDGHGSKAYRYGDVIVVESDVQDEATYVLESKKFDELRLMSRGHLRDSKPSGLISRVIHLGNKEEERQRWRRDIDSKLSGDSS